MKSILFSIKSFLFAAVLFTAYTSANAQGQSPQFFKLGGNSSGAAATFSDRLGFTTQNDLKLVTGDITRMFISKDGNIGIGTENPTERIDIRGNLKASGCIKAKCIEGETATFDYGYFNKQIKVGTNSLYLGSTTPTGTDNNIWADGSPLIINGSKTSGNQNTEINPYDGTVVIGTKADDPADGIHPNQIGQIHLMVKDFLMLTGKNPTLTFRANRTSMPDPNWNGDMGIDFVSGATPAESGLNFWKPWPNNQGADNYMLFVATNGNVGIGTGTPKNKLDVCGTIRAKEIVVETGWCDFVFNKNYKLPSLTERRAFISQYGHLPYMQSEKEVLENGAKVSKAITGLLQNTEEHALYLIEISEKLDVLIKENMQLKERIKLLENK